MKSDFSFSTHTTKKYSLLHSLLAALIGGDTKIAWLEITAKVIAELQLICLLLSFPFEFLDNTDIDTLGKFTQKLAGYFSFKNVLIMDENSIGTNIFLGATLVYLAVLLIYTIVFVVAYFLQKPLSEGALKLWINMSVVHFTCTALYIHQCSIMLIKEAANGKAYIFGTKSSQLFLWMGIFITILNVLFATLTSRFVYEPIKSQYLAAIRTTIPDFLCLSYKLISIPLTILITNIEVQKWIQACLALAILSYRLKIYLYKTPYYYFTIMRLFQCFVFIEFAMVIVNLLLFLINEGRPIKSFTIIYMDLIFCAFFAKLSDIILHSMIKRYGMKKITEIKTKNSFYKKLLATDYIVDRGSISSTIEKKRREGFVEFLYFGVVKAHKETCTKTICGCNLILEKGIMNDFLPIKEEQRIILREFRFSLIQELFEGFNDEEVKVTLANYLFENKLQSYAAAITIIHGLDLTNTSIELKVIRAKLLEKIEAKVLTNYGSVIDIEEIVNYQQLAAELRTAIESNLAKFLKFWETYKGTDPSIKELFKMTMAINKEAEEIKVTWNKIMNKYSRLSYQDHLLFGLYQSFVRSAPYSAEKILQKYFSLSSIFSTQKNRNTLIVPENVFEAQNMIFYILMKKEQLGSVVFVTSNVETSLQYTPHELINKNINTIMPEFYKERHDRILTDHIDKSRNTIINRNRGVFARKKNGYVTPATLFVSIFPYFQKQLIYIGILRPIHTYDEFLLILPSGIIDAFSENLAKTLGLDPDKNRQYILKSISKELDKFRRAFECLANGDREKLRKIVYVNKSQATTSNKQTIHGGSSDNTSGPLVKDYTSKKSVIDKNFKDHFLEGEEENLFKDPEFDDWVRLYELVTSTGVSVAFNKHRADKVISKGIKKVIDFNTIMSEEQVYGSKMLVFRLQNVSVDSGLEDDFDDGDFAESEEDEHAAKTEGSEKSAPSRASQLKGIVRRAKLDRVLSVDNQEPKDTAVPEKKPEFLETEEQGLLVTEQNLLHPNPKQSAFKQGNALDIKTDMSGDDWDFKNLPDDNEMSPFNMNLLQNPFQTRLMSQSSQLRAVENDTDDIKEGPDLELITEQEEDHKHDVSLKVPGQEKPNISGISAAKLFLMQQSRGFLRSEPEDQMSRAGSQVRGSTIASAQKSDTKDNYSFKMKDDDKNSEKKHKLKKFFKEHKLLALEGVHVVEGQDRSSVSSSTRSAKISSKVERAVYSAQTDTSIRILNVLVTVFCAAVVGMIIYYLVMANVNLSRLKSNVDIQKYSTQKLYLVVESNRKARIINIIQRGLVPNARITSDDTTASLKDLLTVGDSLSSYNSKVRLSINKIDKSERQRFYQKIPIIDREDPTTTRHLNSFDACTEIANCAFRLDSLLPGAPAYNDLDLMFIIKNTLNDLLVSNEEVTTILVDDNQINLQRVESTGIVLMILTVVIATGIFIFVARSEMKFMRRKTIFVDSFFRIKDYEIESALSIVANFRKALQEDNKGRRLPPKDH